jgi:hypothetical protein
MKALALVFVSTAILADPGDLTVLEERTEGDRHYVEWSIEGMDSLRIACGLADAEPGWFFLRQHHSGAWDPLFSFLPVMVDAAGINWLGQPRMAGSLALTEGDGGYLLDVSFDHGITNWYGSYIRVTGQWEVPAVRFTGAPEHYSAMSTSPLEWEPMTPGEVREALGPAWADSLLIPFDGLEIHWGGMLGSPVLDRDSVAALDTLSLELSVNAVVGTVSDTKFRVVPAGSSQFRVFERFRWNIFYNEYGCGACWLESRLPGVYSEWLQLERRDDTYTTMDVYQREPYTPVLPEEDLSMAEAWAATQPIEYVVFEGPSVVEFLFRGGAPGGETVEKYLIFFIEPGD